MNPQTRTIAELATHMAQHPRPADAATDPMVAACDANGNGTAEADELSTLLSRFDNDKDGSLAHAEFRAMAEQIGLPKPPEGGPRGMRGAMGPIKVAELGQHILSRIDTDGSGSIDLSSEGTAGPDQGQHLRSADADGDGIITTQELLTQLSSFDTDGDGTISAQEHEARRQPGSDSGQAAGPQA